VHGVVSRKARGLEHAGGRPLEPLHHPLLRLRSTVAIEDVEDVIL
jgi:hypothetical protein